VGLEVLGVLEMSKDDVSIRELVALLIVVVIIMFVFVPLAAVMLCLSAGVIYLFWNYVVSELFNVSDMYFYQAVLTAIMLNFLAHLFGRRIKVGEENETES
jgi:predicted membrane protein